MTMVLARVSVTLTFLLLLPTAPFCEAADPDAGRIGAETCGMCHDDIYEPLLLSVHGQTDPERFCENCHGPGEAHMEGEGDPSLIRSIGTCTPCHDSGNNGPAWTRSEHALAGLGCETCHDVHGSSMRDFMLRDTAPDLCLDCHTSVQADFSLPETHPLGPGSANCTDCHNPHRQSSRGSLGGFKQDACLNCHTEYRGPWFFQHEVVAVEGCTACHAPHGSVNRRLLTYQRVGDLCLQCHPEQPFFHEAVDGTGQRTTGINDCTRCHSEIHGSNNNALFLD
jgi:DmsE family decaheme c-type cytochrome